MKINKKLIDKAILDIKNLQFKYCKLDTMFIYRRLGESLYNVGWDYSELLKGGSPKKRRPFDD